MQKKLLIKSIWINLSLIMFSFLLVVLLSEIPFETRVSRLPATMEWIDNFSNGIFPYKSEINPSGFPFLFYLAMPFYLLGDVGYLAVLGLVLYLRMLSSYSKTGKELIVRMVLLISMIPVAYEIIVRSELFANMSLILLMFFITEKYLNKNHIDIKFIFISMLWGLLLSTRLVAFLIFALYLIYYFRNNLFKGFWFMIISISTFILTLLPYILWDAAYFFSRGPFAIQLLYLPVWVIIIFCFLIAYTSWAVSDIQELFFACGVFLFIVVLSSMITFTVQEGVVEVFKYEKFDISYFVFCIPFFILSVKEYEIKKTIGKVISLGD